MPEIPYFTLNTGSKIPAVGLGTWQSAPGEAAIAVYHALKVGYRHIDGAAIYGNETEVGLGIKRAIEEGLVKREDLFITTKLWVQDFRSVPEALDTSLAKLGLQYVDLYLMHWPVALEPGDRFVAQPDFSITFNEAWASMEALPTEKVRAIGISNFTIADTKKLLATAKVTPAVNQVELHPTLAQTKLVDWLLSGDFGYPAHDRKQIIPEAYSPLAHGNLNNPVVKEIADKYGVSPATIALSWNISRGCVVLPKSVSPGRIESNLHYIELEKDDMETITDITRGGKNLERQGTFFLSRGVDIFNKNEDSY